MYIYIYIHTHTHIYIYEGVVNIVVRLCDGRSTYIAYIYNTP
jgi:hypothetical protein